MLAAALLLSLASSAAEFKTPEPLPDAIAPVSSAAPPLSPALPELPPALFDGAGLRAQQYAVRDGVAGPLPAAARAHNYLLVPGFSWDAVPEYFMPNVKRLRSLGLDAKRVEVDPLGRLFDNARAVRDAVLASDKPVVLIGHSKGGLDALEALKRFPEIRPKVARLVTIQTPYRGTAVADWALKRPWLYATAIAYSRLINPRRVFATLPFFRESTVREMTVEERAKDAAGPPDIGGVPVYSIASRVNDDTKIKLLTWITAGTVKMLTGRHNDGIVAPEDALIPGAIHAVLEHVGHIDTISDPTSWKHKALGVRGHDPRFAADLTEAVVRWVFANL